MKQLLDDAKKLMLQMNGNPQERLKLSGKALKLLEKVPLSRKTDEEILLLRGVVEAGKELKEKSKEICDYPGFWERGREQVMSIDAFIRSRVPQYESVH